MSGRKSLYALGNPLDRPGYHLHYKVVGHTRTGVPTDRWTILEECRSCGRLYNTFVNNDCPACAVGHDGRHS